MGFSWDDRFVVSLADDGGCLVWRHWNEVGERELSEDDSDAEEERAARRRHRVRCGRVSQLGTFALRGCGPHLC